MPKRKAFTPSDDEDEAEYSEAGSDRPIKQKKTPKATKKISRPADRDEDDNDDDEPIAKKMARQPKQRQSTSKRKPSKAEEEEEEEVAVKVNDEGDKYIDLGKKRRATVRSFKGTVFLDIREYYGQEGDEKPGKKGLTLSQEQWEKLKNSSEAIDTLFSKVKRMVG